MKARDMIAGAAFGPDSVKDLQTAFAQVWEAIADEIPEKEHEAARVRLAKTLLALRSEERLPSDRLRDTGMKVMRASYGAHLATARIAPLQPRAPGRRPVAR